MSGIKTVLTVEKNNQVLCSDDCIPCCDFCIYCKHTDDKHRTPIECNHPKDKKGDDVFFFGGGECENFHCFNAVIEAVLNE